MNMRFKDSDDAIKCGNKMTQRFWCGDKIVKLIYQRNCKINLPTVFQC